MSVSRDSSTSLDIHNEIAELEQRLKDARTRLWDYEEHNAFSKPNAGDGEITFRPYLNHF